MITTLIIGLIVITGLVWYFKFYKKEDSIIDNIEVQEDILSDYDKSMNSIINIIIQLKINKREDIINKIEDLKNNLINILEEININYKGMSFEVNNMSQTVLPNRVLKFIDIEITEEDERSFKDDIEKMNKYILSIKDIIHNDKISQNERESMLINIKY